MEETAIQIVEIGLTFLVLAAGVWAAYARDLLAAVIATAIVSLIAAILFYLLQAPDVAMAEASIGAALTTAIFVVAIRKTKRFEE